jgi:hypothetical protein
MVSLELAVPLWIERVRRRWSDESRIARARQLVEVIAGEGDKILFPIRAEPKSRQAYARLGTAEAFNALAEALALLSFAPGGVTFAGRHWESRAEG